jgi:glycosyltransferase involved in cell wall biosynthesis
MGKISAFIIAKNEANRIAIAINSLKRIVDEIIVVDSGSSDTTVSIAENLGAKTLFNQWPGYVKQKAFGEKLCKHDWVLNIDADEELSPHLQDEIEFIFASDNQDRYLAYQIRVVIMHRNNKVPHFLAPYNECIRLYNRKFCSFSNIGESTTHDAVIFNSGIDSTGKIYKLNEIAYHRSGTSIEQLVNKANFYSTEQANDLVISGREISKVRIIFEMLLCFLKAFFIRRYFVFGLDGFIDSVIFSFARFIRLAKAREIKHKTGSLRSREL